jgi:hypothetical protein
METNIEEKILRFAKLSREFSEKPEELDNYPENCTSQLTTAAVNNGYIQIGYSYPTAGACQFDTPESPLERFKKDKKKEIKKAERWYEYVELRNNIEDYFKAKHKLTK